MNRLPKVVFSRTLNRAEWKNTKLVKGDVASEVRELKRQGERNIFVFGSGNLSATLIEHGLFDEYRLAFVPVVLASGKPLFARSSAPTPASHDSGRDNSSMRELAVAAMAALSPARFTSAQRQTAQRQGGIAGVAAAQRMQGARGGFGGVN